MPKTIATIRFATDANEDDVLEVTDRIGQCNDVSLLDVTTREGTAFIVARNDPPPPAPPLVVGMRGSETDLELVLNTGGSLRFTTELDKRRARLVQLFNELPCSPERAAEIIDPPAS